MQARLELTEVKITVKAFEIFLKHLVGGLHTVYTKLKRLSITPLVCNVEQVSVFLMQPSLIHRSVICQISLSLTLIEPVSDCVFESKLFTNSVTSRLKKRGYHFTKKHFLSLFASATALFVCPKGYNISIHNYYSKNNFECFPSSIQQDPIATTRQAASSFYSV